MADRIIGCKFSAWSTANDSVFTPYFGSCINFVEEYEDPFWNVETIEIEKFDVGEYGIYFVSGQGVEVIEIEECDDEEDEIHLVWVQDGKVCFSKAIRSIEIHYVSQISIVKDSENVYCVDYE